MLGSAACQPMSHGYGMGREGKGREGRALVISPQAPASALVLHCLAPGAFGTAELAPGQEQWQSNWDMNCGVVVSTWAQRDQKVGRATSQACKRSPRTCIRAARSGCTTACSR